MDTWKDLDSVCVHLVKSLKLQSLGVYSGTISAIAVSPKMLADFFAKRKAISFLGCALQQWFFGFFVVAEFAMSQRLFIQLVAGPYAIGLNKLVVFVVVGAMGVFSGLTILVSYVCILIAILKIHSAEGRHKAFSTCSSHLMAVSILYGNLVFICLRPSASFSLDLNEVVSVFYTAVIPMLNPLIYSLRNKEVKGAIHRMVTKRKFCRA
ncbi:Olfactory receptor 1009 [Camelus dromedarius]|uniref:Olfactory receptor 1009 n=1 Tax=Camelus dromedarius TaxID=9838 RepID=A0A5N4DLI5_CAMDR|nr:Olfactory receptor 1009 [Camelus dromedarius]